MPIQRTIFGHPVMLSMPPRRFQLLFGIIFIFIVTTFLYGPPTSADIPTYDEVKDAVKNPKEHLPSLETVKDNIKENIPNVPFVGPAVHKAPVQPNSNATSAYGAIQWIYDFKWKSPFSRDVAFDENTAVLPPLPERPSIYTYYEAPAKQSKEVAEAESRLILAWRRAWWAQGFKPQVLGRGEAMKHPQYQLFQRLKLGKIDPQVEAEIMRWLAWGHMGGGILANYLALPMAKYDNPILSFLRKDEYPALSRIDTLQDGLFFGKGSAVEEALKKATASPLFKNITASHDKIVALKKDAGAMVNLLGKDNVKVEPKSDGIAYYSKAKIKNIYGTISDKLTNSTSVEGLDMLATLINSHLHLTFQENYPEGVAVVKPLPEHTTALMYESIDIARNLTQCPTTPIDQSCPPNRSRCHPCNPKKPMKLQLLPSMKDSSGLYTVGTVPHPYTLNSLNYMVDTLDTEFLRKEAGRDLWIAALTTDITSKTDGEEQHSNDKGIIHFKETVAVPNTAANSVWLTAERVSQADLDWIFGFNLPQRASKKNDKEHISDDSDIMVFPRPTAPVQVEGVEIQQERYLKAEEARLQKARDVIKTTDKNLRKVVDAVEAWNIADTEVWKFSRAFSARRRQERKKWEEEEKSFAGSEKKSGVHGGAGGDRWSDRH